MRTNSLSLLLITLLFACGCCGLRCRFVSSMNWKVGYILDLDKVDKNYGNRYFHQSEEKRRYEVIREDENEIEYLFYYRTLPKFNFKCRYTLTVDKKTNIVKAWKELPQENGKYECYGNH